MPANELELVDIMKGAHKSPEHVARQPFGQLPAIDDGGFKMFESHPHAMTFIYHDVFKRPQQEEALANAGAKLEKCVGVVDAALAAHGKPFLVGDQFTLADVAFAPYVEYCMVSPSAKAIFAKHPHFTAWWNRVSERSAWHKVRA